MMQGEGENAPHGLTKTPVSLKTFSKNITVIRTVY